MPGLILPLCTNCRSYCSRKLRRMYKSLKLTHGRGKYQKRTLEAGSVTEVG